MTIASHFIDGKAVESSDGETDDVIDPSNGADHSAGHARHSR